MQTIIIVLDLLCLFLSSHAEGKTLSAPILKPRELRYTLVEATVGILPASIRNDDGPVSEDLAFEWSGVFETPDRMYTWSAQRVNGKYADASMKFLVLSAPNSTVEALNDLKPIGQHVFAQRCRPAQYQLVEAGEIVTPNNNTCYVIHFDTDSWQTLFKVNTASSPHTAFFTEHLPTEFKFTDHYLKDTHGDDAIPSAEAVAEGVEDHASTPWGAAIGAAIAINLVTLSGVVFLVPAVKELSQRFENEFAVLVAAFAAGAMLSCAFNLLLFEASHLITAGGFEDEASITWRWGAMILAGFLTATLIDCIIGFISPDRALQTDAAVITEPDSGTLPRVVSNVPAVGAAGTDPAAPAIALTAILGPSPGPASKDPEAAAAADAPPLRERARLIVGVLVGDFLHNLCDGIFLAAAFRVCGDSFGWAVASATVIHEVAQELSDYAVLVSPAQGGLRVLTALALNFVSGLSVVLGTVVVLAADVSDISTGLILAFGGGVYIHIGAAECMPRVYRLAVAPAVRLLALLAFVLGAVAIALVLLNHQHCPAGSAGAADPHAGHNH